MTVLAAALAIRLPAMLVVLLFQAIFASPAAAKAITLDDVLAMERIDRVAVSPNGNSFAVAVLRGALPGEIYGRTAYEVDPSRADIWLIDRASGVERNLTQGRAVAAGAWCPMWSPDGQRLAYLSTRPEAKEPRGGNNVRLYVWSRGDKRPRRLGDWAVATQTRYGGSIRKLDLAGPNQFSADPCRKDEDNPPFVWLDSRRVLVAALAPGQVSGLLDETDRIFRHTAETRQTLREGRSSLASAGGSGIERTVVGTDENVMLAVVDATSGERIDISEVPAYPFNGSLAVRISPDGRRAAILATVGALPPRAGVPWPRNDGEWQVEKQLGIVDIAKGAPVRWINTPEPAKLPLALLGWSSDGRQISFTARSQPQDTTFEKFAVDAASQITSAQAASSSSPKQAEPDWLPVGANLIANDDLGVVWSEMIPGGTFIRAAKEDGTQPRNLLSTNTGLADIDLGRSLIFDYPGPDGSPLKAAVLLPPGHREGDKLAVITWVYGGYVVQGEDDYFLDPYMPGIYNLRLYAAHGYAVLIPSIPLKRDGTQDHLTALAPAVLPAIDKLVTLGIADPKRIGVMGQSYGGYTALGLATQTDRFRAVAAIAPMSDITAFYAAFDPTSRGYPGIEHEKSVNPLIAELGTAGIQLPFYADPERYRRNSPLSHVDRVTAPVLLIHGEHDVRRSSYQSEAMFSGLWRQGKTARIRRYWGENHSLAASPATVRDVVAELLSWFDRYLREDELGTVPASSSKPSR